jgi:hypothetical protein
MLAKQITSKLKQESDSSQINNPSNNLNVNQCDRIIRSVSCKVSQ